MVDLCDVRKGEGRGEEEKQKERGDEEEKQKERGDEEEKEGLLSC